MDVVVYKNTSPNNVVDKSIKKIHTFSGVKFKHEGALDILNPTILVQYSDEVSDFTKFNYVQIAKLNRYYYIVNMSFVGGLCEIQCKCDVLMSHKNSIYASKQYILRQQEKYKNPYLFDDLLPIRSDHNYIMKPFGENVDNRQCGRVILATAGEGGRIVP